MTVCVPLYDGSVNYSAWSNDMGALINGGIAVPDVTFLCESHQDYSNRLGAMGFNSLYNVAVDAPARIYTTPTNYFEFDGVCYMSLYANGVYLGRYNASTTYSALSLMGEDGSYIACNNYGSRGVYLIARTNTSMAQNAAQMWDGALETTGDPYGDNGGTSEPGGGDGDFDDATDSVDFPDLPTVSATNTGFITLFNPSLVQLQTLSAYMWSSGFDLDTLKKLFADPMDAILGLSIVPCSVPNGGLANVKVGNIDTGVSMTKAASQYVVIDCGSVTVKKYWGAYLDYSPYTKAQLYLPFIGIRPIDIDEIMGKTVHIKYYIDILSGACSAFVKVGNSILYNYIGQCASSIPITGSDWTNVINGVLGIAGAIGTTVATGGAAAPMAAMTIASTAVNSLKPTIEKSGALSGTGGMLGVKKPYLIIQYPNQAVPKRQNAFIGYPSFVYKKINALDGYNELESVHLENIPATGDELAEIEAIVKSGVIY